MFEAESIPQGLILIYSPNEGFIFLIAIFCVRVKSQSRTVCVSRLSAALPLRVQPPGVEVSAKVHCDSVGVAAADVLDEQAAQSLQRPRNRTLARVAVPETSVVVSSPAQHVPVALSVHR